MKTITETRIKDLYRDFFNLFEEVQSSFIVTDELEQQMLNVVVNEIKRIASLLNQPDHIRNHIAELESMKE